MRQMDMGVLYIKNGGNQIGASHNVVNADGRLKKVNKQLKKMVFQSRRETINHKQ